MKPISRIATRSEMMGSDPFKLLPIRCVAIDPSLTGTAVAIATSVSGIRIRVYKSKPCGHTAKSRIDRYHRLANGVLNGCGVFNVGEYRTVVFIEGYSYGSKGQGVSAIYEFGGILRMLLLDRGCTVVEVTPSTLKKFTTGKGNAPKEVMAAHVAKRWRQIFKSNDTTDAYALMRLGLCVLGKDTPVVAHQSQAIELVTQLWKEAQ